MGTLFRIDGPIYNFCLIVYQLFIINVLWLLFSIPIFTIGASTTALLYTSNNGVRNKKLNLFSDFWKSFRQNFFKATFIWLILGGAFIVVLLNIKYAFEFGGNFKYFIPLQAATLIELLIVGFYIFPILAKYKITLKNIFKAAFYIGNKHLFTTFLCLATLVGCVTMVYYFNFFLLFFMGIYALSVSYFIKRVSKNYFK